MSKKPTNEPAAAEPEAGTPPTETRQYYRDILEETITVKRADLEEIRLIWFALEGLDGILQEAAGNGQYFNVESVLRIIRDKFNTAFEDIDDLLRESE